MEIELCLNMLRSEKNAFIPTKTELSNDAQNAIKQDVNSYIICG